MKVFIIEDERIASERLQMLLKEQDENIEIAACPESVEEAVSCLNTQPQPDLLFLDIQLADGFSFEIFNRTAYNKPVIFTTAYNEYALEAFKYLSIDYLLKPVTARSLANALHKYTLIAKQSYDYSALLQAFKQFDPLQYKERFLVKLGQKLFFVKTTEIAYFFADDKLVYLVDSNNSKFTIDYTLDKLETLLNPRCFFRLNRKAIVGIDSIVQVKPYTNSRLLLQLKHGPKIEEFIISRERVHQFREWAEQ